MKETEGDAPRVLPRSEHPISRSSFSPNALKVLSRLRQKGFKAYLVGGSVRDLMLGITPKDYDIATDARPPEVRRLFRNSRLIGRRFRIVHVIFGGEIIEVATFRRDPDPRHQNREQGDLLVTSDNTYGTPGQDAARRDFTVNGLFYDIGTFSVIDYVGGIEDLERRLIRVIGDPDVRMQEDPVRMMRACEFAGRLDFGMDPATQDSIQDQREQLELASPVRLTEEVLQLLRSGRAAAAIQWMLDLGLLEVLLPEAYAMLGRGAEAGGLGQILPTLDRLQDEGWAPSDATLLALTVLPQILRRRDDIEALDERPMTRAALRRLVEDNVAPFVRRFALSKARTAQTVHALVGFHRMCEPEWTPKSRAQLAHRPYFDDALQLFELLVEATDDGREQLEVWREARRQRASVSPRPDARRGRRRRRGRSRRGRARR